MKDERIQSTLNRYAAVGFLVWYMLLSISLMCRALILKQPPGNGGTSWPSLP
jgi:hypothetical protein